MATGVASWSQTASSNATADSNVGMAEGMAPSAVNDGIRALMASVAMWRDDMAGTLTTGGTSTAYTVTTNQGFATLAALSGRKLVIKFNATNGASPTLNVDGLGAKAIKLDTTTAIPTAVIRKNTIHHLTYDNSNSCFILHNGDALEPPGIIKPYAGTAAPNGYLLCDGSAVSRTTYADLFAVTSTTFGVGNGTTTFNVPDLNGRVPVGKDNAGGSNANRITTAVSGIDGDTLGASGGDQLLHAHTHTISITDPGHDHTPQASSSSSGLSAGPSAKFLASSLSQYSNNHDLAMGATNTNTTGITATAATTGTGASQNVQPSLIVNYVIKT